ncbi:hypothetical protein M406DRAFT_294043 [Cryphonectria parasitica EP155]|uniref:Uncharacterized protein n=1 Tax=Cryphonectria parasitica (strain ATCC 38755 / EP155) TaxID=660469 RepID=A0A9P4XWU6_CRYP1|nr:uncharacterized protein M406DRAFT_294043 [Cryphonectria parasitica EP155]KAF3762361.1 hypothetical protein M406DRAFT_294043 [Cryphonectria parasitica EP155]
MASPSFSHLLHPEPAVPSQPPPRSHPHSQFQPQPSAHAQTAHQPPPSSSSPRSLPQPARSLLPPQRPSNDGNPSPSLDFISVATSAYNYPAAPPSTVSPAASGSAHSVASPVTSPTAHTSSASAAGPGLSRNHAPNSSLYQCADCLKRYSRPEHLQRHVATHTLGKRFVCDVCGKAFGRADLLKRHRANHNDDGNGNKRRRINSSPGAGRVAHACQACAKARVKCEDTKPCTRCRHRNLTCEYASSEAGSAAAMHLLHFSASAHSDSSSHSHTHPPPMHAPPTTTPSGPPSRNLGPEPLSSQTGQSGPIQRVHTPAALAMTNPPSYAQSTSRSPPIVATHTQGSNEAVQLPTPETMIDHSEPHLPSSFVHAAQLAQNHAAVVDMSRPQFGDFLQNVLYDPQQQQQLASSRMNPAQGLAVLDFCDDANLDMDELDFGLIDDWNLGNINGMLATDPNLASYIFTQAQDSAELSLSHMRQRLVSIWVDSPWRWMPDANKDNMETQKSNLPLIDIKNSQLQPDKVVNDKMEASGRDKVLAIILSTCQNNSIMGRVASSFPSTEVMDSLVHVFLAWHLCQVSEFIHFGSFSMNGQSPEWLGVTAAAGAILTPVRSLWKFGFAVQEAVRITIPMRFEDNNTKIQDISLVQALVLNHDIGLWSGNRRRMEIAECHLNIPVAMTRGRGLFQQSHYEYIHVDVADEGSDLDAKWKLWYQHESWKRLIFHLFIRDAQTSMTSMINPHISYAELTLPLPEARELWFAKTAQEWKMHYLRIHAGPQTTKLPSLGDLLRDFDLLATDAHRLDVRYCISIFLHGFWTFIREYCQMNSIYRWSNFSPNVAGNPNILLQSRQQEHVKALEQFQLSAAQKWPHMLIAQENLVLNLLLMNLHVSFEDLQLFSGKEGDDQARRILPALKRWVQDSESRRAIWHAGQILQWAKEFPVGHLKDFSAIAVHHAALALWTWGVVTRAMRRGNGGFDSQTEPVIHLDMPDSAPMRQFVVFGSARPAIRGPTKRAAAAGSSGGYGPVGESSSGSGGMGTVTQCFIDEPTSCMAMVEDILRANFPGGQAAPIVENLCHLIQQLGKAAGAVGLG